MSPVFLKYTWKNLKENRTRTLVTIVGIVLSVALVTAVTVSISSVLKYAERVAIDNTGDWHLELYAADEKTVDGLEKDSRVSKYGVLQEVGYAGIGSENEYKPYLFVGAMSGDFSQIMTLQVTEGRMPENDTELLIPNHLKSNGGVELTLGQSLTLSLGYRERDGQIYHQHVGFVGGEGIAVPEQLIGDGRTATYTVVGFYDRPGFEDRNAPGYTALTVESSENGSTDSGEAAVTCEVWILLKNIKNASGFLAEMEDNGLEGQLNRQRIRYSGGLDNDLTVLLYTMAAILMIMVVVGSVSLIYNAFSISVKERIRQFGLLKSLGATRRQIMGSVLCEGLMLCIVGIPIGLLAGCAGIGITIWGCRDLFEIFLKDFSETVEFGVYAGGWALLLAVLLGLFTVLLSAWLPARKALRLPAIEAIRQSGEAPIRSRRVRTGPLTRKLFGLEGMLAAKNFKRSRKRYRSTVFSLFFSIVLFICANSFCHYLTKSVEDESGGDSYDISYNMHGFTEEVASEVFNHLKGLSGVDDSVLLYYQHMTIDTDPESITEKYAQYMGSSSFLSCRVIFVEDETYRGWLEKNGLDAERYLNTEDPVALVYDRVRIADSERVEVMQMFDRSVDALQVLVIEPRKGCEDGQLCFTEEGAFVAYRADAGEGDSENGGRQEILIPMEEAVQRKEVQIGQFLDSAPWFASGGITQLFLPASVKDSWAVGGEYPFAYFLTQNHSQVYEEMSSLSHTVYGGYVIDYAETMVETRALLTLIKVFTTGFLVLISLIAAANVFNTISTNVLLRRREFAMLRSVGMTEKGLYRTLNYECLMYGMKSLLYAIPVSVVLTWLIYEQIKRAGVYSGFYIPWQTMAVAVGAVFAVVFSTMLYAAGKLKTEDLAEALRSENA